MLNYGDLFYIDDKEYVFLFSDGESIYAAIILGPEETKGVKQLEKKDGRRGVSQNKLLYCYVELSTKNYSECSANMARAQKEISFNSEVIRPSTSKLDEFDLKEIRHEILESRNLFKPVLVEYMESIFIE